MLFAENEGQARMVGRGGGRWWRAVGSGVGWWQAVVVTGGQWAVVVVGGSCFQNELQAHWWVL